MKTEYKFQTKVGQTVYYIEINIRCTEPKYKTKLYANGIHIKELKIVYQSKRKIALSGDLIPTIDRPGIDEDSKLYNNYLCELYISIKTDESYFPNGIFGNIYTAASPEIGIDILEKAMIKKVETDYGFLRDMNISSIINTYKSKL